MIGFDDVVKSTGTDLVWLVLLAFFISRGMIKTGLGRRVGLLFMRWMGRYSWLKSVAIGVIVSAVIFAMFEIWFKVPLYKGTWNPLFFLPY